MYVEVNILRPQNALRLEDRTPLYVSYTGRVSWLVFQLRLHFFSNISRGNSEKLPVEVVFVGVAALGSILAYEGERTSRARFRSKVKAGMSQHDKTCWHLRAYLTQL